MIQDPGNPDADRTHPIDKVSYFSQVFFTWVKSVVTFSKHSKFTQNMHCDLPKRDNIRHNEETFLNNFEQEKGLFKTIIKTFKKDFLIGIIWATLFVIADYSVTIVVF